MGTDSDSDDALFAPGVTGAWGKRLAAPEVQKQQRIQQSRDHEAKIQQQNQDLLQKSTAAQEQQSKQSQGKHEKTSRSRSAHRRQEPGSDLQAGDRVRLHSLKTAGLNGQCGALEMFVSESKRWRVSLDAGAGSKDLKPENLEKLSVEKLPVQASSDSVHLGCTVKLHGLKGAKELNGQEGVVEEFVKSSSRWRVKLESGQCKDLKSENLEVVEPEVMDVEETEANTADCGTIFPGGSEKRLEEEAQQAPKRASDFGNGFYIVCDPGARLNDGPSLNDNQIAMLAPGTRIEVQEIRMLEQCSRLRGRISQPWGWMSLLNTENGQPFAIPDATRVSTQWDKLKYDRGGVVVKVGDACGPGGRFVISEFLGEGGYSTVWLGKDILNKTDYALKFTRADAKERRTLEREIKLLSHLAEKGSKVDPDGSKYILSMVFLEGFEHNGHLGVVLEPMKCNMLTALERHGGGVGLPLLPTLRDFGKHLFLALRVLRQAGLIHADVKPENLLVARDSKSIKLSDFGNMLTVSEAENVVDEHQMPLFFRAPEVILGQPFGTEIDVFGAAASLYQMATDRFLFIPRTNNEMIHEMLKICGAFPQSTMTGQLIHKHFDLAGNFLLQKHLNTGTSVEKLQVSSFNPPPRPISELLKVLLLHKPDDYPHERHERLVGHFGDLLTKCLEIDAKARATPNDALNCRFFAKGAGDMMADLAVMWAEHRKT